MPIVENCWEPWALALPGSAWAQPGSGDAPVMVMPLPASPLLIEAAVFAPAQLDIPSLGVTAAVAPVGTVTIEVYQTVGDERRMVYNETRSVDTPENTQP